MPTSGGTIPADPVTAGNPVEASLTVPSGALSAITTLTITEFAADDPALPAPPANSLPSVFQFTPSPLTFDQDVTITLFYLDATPNDGFEDTTGVNENLLQVNLLVTGAYVTVGNCTGIEPANPDPCVPVSGRDTAANTITVRTRHFTIYGVSGPAATPTPTPTPTPAPFSCDGKPATIVGTKGNNVIFGTNGDDVIVALGGNDIVFGLRGNDTICLGKGDDLGFGGEGLDIILGEQGSDFLFGNEGDDDLDGGRGNDFLFGGHDNDDLDGGRGLNDFCHGGNGLDTAVRCESQILIP